MHNYKAVLESQKANECFQQNATLTSNMTSNFQAGSPNSATMF
jgi:hypothetical protein